ncbi:apolipoprotein N-acyltransferase [Roseimicrobium gellanilyticum]|uniref:Apolipoprotein N-acyltransferase n=1 Tax=Roseimicrobium gellanilyticum TaxID=748857 RepID=A0A366HN96_9BACT|nr:apolipoprotein N-acyltransferase [Roseimicrobium gellanilyticum]RBP44637.1 apolipoprotein N-acyltransferase [Roseimicrobium gellanilyticum]
MRIPPFLAALAAGFILVFAYPGWNHGWLVWLWMLPLLYALWGWDNKEPAAPAAPANGKPPKRRSPAWRGFRLAYLAGLAFFIPNLNWVRHSSRVISGASDNSWAGLGPELMGMGAVVGLSIYISLYWGLWGAFAATIGRPRISPEGNTTPGDSGKLFSVSLESLRAAFLCAAAWVACEWLRGIVFTGFGWNGLGIALWKTKLLIQGAEFVGVTGLSFMPVFVVCIFWNTQLRFRQEVRTSRVRPHADFFCAVALVLLNAGYGMQHLMEQPKTDVIPLKVALVQGNIGQQEKWDGRRYEDVGDSIYNLYGKLTVQAVMGNPDEKPQLVIWPESALPFPFHDPNHVDFLNDILGIADYSLLTGADILIPMQPNYTGASLMRGNFNNHQLHRKVHLVPFGEYLPLRNFPGMDALLGGVIMGDFQSGPSTEPLKLEEPAGVQLMPLICFEDTVGRLARKFVREAPQLLVNLTNDGWFLHSEENEQHLANAVFRCIELRRPMVRACNTGITCFLDDKGRIPNGGLMWNEKDGYFYKGILKQTVNLEKSPPMTVYARFGDVFSIAMLVIMGVAILVAVVRKRR